MLLLYNAFITAPMVTAAPTIQRAVTAVHGNLSMTTGKRGKNHLEMKRKKKKSRRRRLKDEILFPKKDFQNEAPENKPDKNPNNKNPNKNKGTDPPTYTPTTLQPTTSVQPSIRPTDHPTDKPSKLPSSKPSPQPSVKPSFSPTHTPTDHPTGEPTKLPSARPTYTPGSPTPLPTLWKTAWHGDFTVKMSVFTFSEGDYIPPSLAKNGSRRQLKDIVKEHESVTGTTWSQFHKAPYHSKHHNFFIYIHSALMAKQNRQWKGISGSSKAGMSSSTIPNSRNHEESRSLKIIAGDIRDGEESELVHDVLTTFTETLCNDTDLVILTPRTSVSHFRRLDENLLAKSELQIEEDDVLVDFCLNDNKPVDRFKDYSKRDTVINAHFKNYDTLELEDRDTYVNDIGDSLHWVEWEVHYDVIQVDRFTLADVGNDINEGVENIKRRVQRVLSLASTSGIMDEVLKEKNELILASSPIGSEALRFPEALDRWLLENESNMESPNNPTPIVIEPKTKSDPLLSPLQISGIAMLALLLLFTTTIVRHAKKNEENKNSDNWNRDVFTYEGVDFMLDAGRRNASMEQQQHEQEPVSNLAEVQILVKPKYETPVVTTFPSSGKDHETRMALMSIDGVPMSHSFRHSTTPSRS